MKKVAPSRGARFIVAPPDRRVDWFKWHEKLANSYEEFYQQGSIPMSTTNIPVANNQTANVSGTMQRPQWLDEQLYPFLSHFVEVDGNRIHYIDEGTGPTLLLLQPGVGWSFVYS